MVATPGVANFSIPDSALRAPHFSTALVAFSMFAAYPHASQKTASFSPVSAGTMNSCE